MTSRNLQVLGAACLLFFLCIKLSPSTGLHPPASIGLLTNNPKKLTGLNGYGLQVVEQVPLKIEPNPHNEKYLRTKREKMGHLLEGD